MTNSSTNNPFENYQYPTLNLLGNYNDCEVIYNDFVPIESVLETADFQNSDMKLPLALGKTESGDVYLLDLAKASHLLIAGAHWFGLQTGLRTLITSLLFKQHPDNLKLVLIDTHRVHFDSYNKIANHFLATIPENIDTPVVFDINKALKTLRSVSMLMNRRFNLLEKAGACNIEEYNNMLDCQLINPADGHKHMPYVVLVINEIGDLIMTHGKNVEILLNRMAQLSRAVGIHIIIATQRLNKQCITEAIKANFTTRIAFHVNAPIDSRLIIDSYAASLLKKKGSMLLLNDSHIIHLQCAYTDEKEMDRINDFIASQPAPDKPMIIPFPTTKYDFVLRSLTEEDPLFDDAIDFILANETCTLGMLVREFWIGYNRTCLLIRKIGSAALQGNEKAKTAWRKIDPQDRDRMPITTKRILKKPTENKQNNDPSNT